MRLIEYVISLAKDFASGKHNSVYKKLSLWAHDLTVIMTVIRLNGFTDKLYFLTSQAVDAIQIGDIYPPQENVKSFPRKFRFPIKLLRF